MSTSKSPSAHSGHHRHHHHQEDGASESDPLLPNAEPLPTYSASPPSSTGGIPASGTLRRGQQERWATVSALTLLCACVLSVIGVAFLAPAAAEHYAQEAVSVDLTSISLHSFTSKGIRVHVKANVGVDAKKVGNWAVRTLGRFGSSVVRSVNVHEFELRVHLPEYENMVLGTAQVPAMTVDVRNGHTTALEFLSDTKPGSFTVVKSLVKDYLSGTLKSLRVVGEVDLKFGKGFLTLGPDHMIREFILNNQGWKSRIPQELRGLTNRADIPSTPSFDITRIHAEEVEVGKHKAILANVSATVDNPYPLKFDVPPLGFLISLPGCDVGSQIDTATVVSSEIHIKPKTNIEVDVSGVVRSLPAGLTSACPGTDLSPMDAFLGNYLHGQDAIVYVSGDGSGADDTAPAWLVELLHSITVPVPFPGHSFDNVIQSFSLSHVNIKLPSGEGGPDENSPLISANVEVIINLPEQVNVPLDINKLKAIADVAFEKHNFGTLELKKWIPATSEPIPETHQLRVIGQVRDVPINITDYAVFQKVVTKLLFGAHGVMLGIEGTADANILTSLGDFVVHDIPAAGNITLDGFPGLGSMPHLKLNDILITETTAQSLKLTMKLSAENPTPWEAYVPYANVLISSGDQILGNGTITNFHLTKGVNDIVVNAAWDPLHYSGHAGVKAGEDLMGHYISGTPPLPPLETPPAHNDRPQNIHNPQHP